MPHAPPAPRPVYLLAGDATMVEEIASLISRDDIRVEVFSGFDAIADALASTPSAVLVLDTAALPAGQDLAQAIAELSGRAGSRPDFLCILRGQDIRPRLEAMRAGAQGYLIAPFKAEALAARLAKLTAASPTPRHRVLIVDDMMTDAMIASRILGQAGYETRVATDPLLVIEALDDFHPDLVLMDFHMPGANGCELSAIIRDHEDHFLTPIVFLSGESDPERQVEARSAGADDFITKPMAPDHLVRVVEGRIRRMGAISARLGGGAIYDEASGLYSRRYLLRELEAATKDPAFRAPGNGLIYLDIDLPAKRLQEADQADRDAMLAQVGHILRYRIGAADIAARFGASSFVVLSRRRDTDALHALAEDLHQAFAASVVTLGGRQLRPSPSFGIVHADTRVTGATEMLKLAETACAQARQAGGKRVETYAPPRKGADPGREARLFRLLGEALTGDALRLVYQPMISVEEQGLEHYDALLRLRTKEGDCVLPNELLPAARERGLVRAIDRWVFRRALDVLAERKGAGREMRLIVRQSMGTIGSEEWATWIAKQLSARRLGACTPILEFRLQDLLEHLDLANTRFDALAALGLDVCIGDFNDDPAALTILEDLPIAFVKPAHELVADAGAHQRLCTLVRQAHDQGAKAVLARIESLGEIGRAWDCGADFVLGYFVQPPQETPSFDFGAAGRD